MFANLKNVITSGVGRQVLITQKHSPALLFGAGAIGMVATAVLASRATLRMHEVLEGAEKDRQTASDVLAMGEEKYSQKDYKSDLNKIKLNAAVQVVKLYAPAIGVGVLTLGCLTGSHVILTRRNAALTAAYATLEKAYKEYRERVSQEVGSVRERELYYGLEDKEIVEENEDGSGPVVKTVKTVGSKGLRSPYAIKFAKGNPNWRPSNDMNEFTLDNVRQFATYRLQKRGHLFLNELHDLLGVEHTKEGAVVGWVMGNGDGFVSFTRNESGLLYLTGYENEVWLDPNVDGVIYDKLDSNFDKDKEDC